MTGSAISDAASDRLATWHGTRPIATLMGEFSAGKSTLLNFLLGQDAAPTKVTATHMPPTWFTYSDSPFTVGLRWDGQEVPVTIDSDHNDLRDDYLVIRRGLDSAVLQSCDVIDAPGISDPGLHKDSLQFLARYTDAVVWCTAANQAWRQTENAAYAKLSEQVRAQSLLVITRMDKLRHHKDQGKVLKRVRQDAGQLFHSVLPLQTPKAASVPLPDRTDDADGLWVTSGGADVMAAFSDMCANATLKPRPSATVTAEAIPA